MGTSMIIDLPTISLISEVINHGLIVIDSEHTIIYVNEKYCRICEIPADRLLNKKIDVIRRSRLAETLKTAKSVVGEVYGVNADDIIAAGYTDADMDFTEVIADHAYYINRAPIIRDGRVVGAIGVVKDKEDAFHVSSTLHAFRHELEYYRAIMDTRALSGVSALAYDSLCMQEIKKIARKAAKCDLPVLLTGETGTGKEVFANAIQSDSLRKDKAFVKVNCSAIPEALMESEFFGYEPGAFTGAGSKARKGKFELAHEGTIFLDEIGDLPFNTQAKLLRVLQEKSFERLGGTAPIHSDFRVIAATNRDLKSLVRVGKFREDLYYRLNTIPIALPPLREHPEDIPRLVRQMVHELNMRYRTFVTLDEEVFVYLQSLYYEGNVRELKNMVERAYALSEGALLRTDCFKLHADRDLPTVASPHSTQALDRLQSAERTAIEHSLVETDYNCNRAAKRLGISRATLYRKISKYNIPLRRP